MEGRISLGNLGGREKSPFDRSRVDSKERKATHGASLSSSCLFCLPACHQAVCSVCQGPGSDRDSAQPARGDV